jgi:prepilin-type N-terminal cleavage/methylation domain-containing protein
MHLLPPTNRLPASQLPVRQGGGRPAKAFTLIELLVVIGIIGILAATAVPAIRSLTSSNTVVAGHRQILGDLAYARQLAISTRQTVYFVLLPEFARSGLFSEVQNSSLIAPEEKRLALRTLTNLLASQYTGYALFARRTVGDQPGAGFARYLMEWRNLPDGMLFSGTNFIGLATVRSTAAATNRPLALMNIPFPRVYGSDPRGVDPRLPSLTVPYIAFGPNGSLSYEKDDRAHGPEEFLGLSRGSIFYPRDSAGRPVPGRTLDLVLTPPGNREIVRVNGLTGRARVDQVEVR